MTSFRVNFGCALMSKLSICFWIYLFCCFSNEFISRL